MKIKVKGYMRKDGAKVKGYSYDTKKRKSSHKMKHGALNRRLARNAKRRRSA